MPKAAYTGHEDFAIISAPLPRNLGESSEVVTDACNLLSRNGDRLSSVVYLQRNQFIARCIYGLGDLLKDICTCIDAEL